MPLFITDVELERCSHNASLIADKADSFIRALQLELETVKAQADASSITSEQTCALIEQKYLSLSSDFAELQSQNAQLSTSLEKRLSELIEVQAEKKQLHIKAISKDGDVERLSVEAFEHHKSKWQLVEMLGQKDIEIGEKNATIKSYLDKIVNLIEDAALKEARLHDKDAELACLRSGSARLSQEKELIEKHNLWLDEELRTKVNSLIELRRTHTEFEADMSAKLANVEKKFKDCSICLKLHKERVGELERKLTSLQEELFSTKDAAAANEERYSAEKSTISKLVDLYKESAKEWSRKAGELEGVIKALETHLSQVDDDYKEKLEKEASARKDFEKEASDLKEKLGKYELEIVNARKPDKLSLLPPSSLQSDSSTEELCISGTETGHKEEDSRMLVPKVPVGVSETALAASLLRDGWSLARMYEKCQEAVDALHHEQLGRKHSQAILERVLYEIEEKAEVISDERVEHERTAEAYNLTNQKLQQTLSENAYLENIIRELKVDLRRHERDDNIAQKEIIDLQKQVTVLLKECRDIQLRCGVASQDPTDSPTSSVVDMEDGTEVEKLTFKDVNGLVGQNVQLRRLVHSLSIKHDQIDAELKEKFEMELKKHIDEASSKVASVLERSEEQGRMIESLHDSVAMYKRLYEEELKSRASYSHLPETFKEDGGRDLILLSEGSQLEATKKALEQAAEQVRNLEDDLAKSRSEAIALRLDRDKLAMEANFARERLDSFMKEFKCQRDEMNEVLARNVEFSQLIVDYQRRLRESADSLSACDVLPQKLSMEVSVLKHEKDILIISEKRASDEVRSLSERVHRLQATMDTIHSAEEIREEARAMEKRKHEEHLKRVEREWAEARKELQEERDHVRTLTLDREETLKNTMRKGEEAAKELADALRAVAASEARAAIAEARCSELEAKLISPEEKTVEDSGFERSVCSTNEAVGDLRKANEEILKLKDEAQAYKDHMLQYKEIAQVNEVSLKQMESAHERFKAEADKLKKSLEAEILSLRSMVSELESDVLSKTTEAASAVAEKEEALSSALAEIKRLNEDNSGKIAQMVALEVQMSSLKEDLEKEQQRWHTAQNNYQRQVILQSETIQELTRTSQALALLQDEASELRKLADARKSENDFLKATWEEEKSDLQELKDEAERKYNEINDQNKILLNHIEALHIKLAEKERTSAGICSGSTYQDPQGDDDLEKVASYLRRSKEMAETEFSLLKQEKLRLQSQLENALKASETAQDLLHSEHASSRDTLFTNEEFKSFKLQVREMNLLRESNMQLREENKHNFEECQKYREIAQKAKMEAEHLGCLLKEKQIEVDTCRKEIEMKDTEIEQLEHKISEMKQKEKEAVSEDAMKLASEKQQYVSSLEQGLANSQLELTEMQKKMGDTLQIEATLKSEAEKQKKLASHFKKRVETLTKEKEELSREKQAISKQLEDARSSKKATGEAANEQAMKEKEKEKDTRLQMLEKTLEREREDLQKEKEDHRNEKSKRQKIEKMVLDLMQTVNQEKKKLLEELESHKHARDSMLETSGITSAQLPSETGLDDQTAAYFLAVDNFDDAVNSALNGLGANPVPSEASLPADASLLATGQQVPDQTLTTLPPSMIPLENSSPVKITEERKKRANMAKSNVDARKVGRKLVRPRLERMEEPTADTDASGMEGSSTSDAKPEAFDAVPQGELTLPPFQLARKRLASSSASELREETLSQQVTISDIAPLLKKSKGSDSPQEGTKEQSNLLASENPEMPLENLDDSAGRDLVHATIESVVVTKEEERENTKEPTDEPKEPLDGMNEDGLQNEFTASVEEFNEKPKETADEVDSFLKVGEVPEPQQSTAEAENERVDGELIPDGKPQEGSGPLIIGMDMEPGECLAEPVTGATVEVSDAIEIGSPEVLNQDKNEIGEVMEEVAEGSDKSNNYNDHSALESQRSPQASFGSGEGLPNLLGDSVVTKQASPSFMAESEEVKELQGGRSTTTIDIRERARARSALPNLLGDSVVSKQASPSFMAESEEVKELQGGRSTTTIDKLERARARAALPNLLGDSVVSKQASPSFMAESEEVKELQGGRSTTTIDIRERARARAALPNLLGDSVISKQASPSFMAESEEVKELQGGRSTTTIDIRERARARAALRQAGVVSPPLARGRGRAFGNIKKDGGRGGRGGRGERGQSSGDKEQG